MPEGARPGILAISEGKRPLQHTLTRKLMTSATLNQATETYNGWANYETWNVALWLQNDFGLYSIARRYDDYSKFVARMGFGDATPDGVSFASPKLDYNELNEMLQEL